MEDPNNELTSSTRFVLHQLIELDKPIEKVTDYLIAYANTSLPVTNRHDRQLSFLFITTVIPYSEVTNEIGNLFVELLFLLLF